MSRYSKNIILIFNCKSVFAEWLRSSPTDEAGIFHLVVEQIIQLTLF